MRRRGFVVAISGLIAVIAMAPRPGMAQHSISCSSDDGKRHYCTVDTRGGVSMKRQRSDAGCEEGFSWGYDRRGIWVDHGCRADFVVNAGYGGEPPESEGGRLTITCSSDDGKRHSCPADTRGGVRMFNQRSKARCTEGSSWGYDRSGVWVDHGCRADFRLRQ
jgi:Protein of unknown function (DUF3011)